MSNKVEATYHGARHDFYLHTGGMFAGRWECTHCHIKVRDTDTAGQLEGQPCHAG
jgi:hypothetical protein